jgi:hypothetical protein
MTTPDKIRVVAELVRQDQHRALWASLAAWCPRCGAEPGDTCERPDGEDYRTTYAHSGRRSNLPRAEVTDGR